MSATVDTSGLNLQINNLKYVEIPTFLNLEVSGVVVGTYDFWDLKLAPIHFGRTEEDAWRRLGSVQRVAVLDFSENLDEQLAELKEHLREKVTL